METYHLINCARCGGEHDATFKPLTNPIPFFEQDERTLEFNEYSFTHWSPCPVNGEPILMFIQPEKKA